MDGPSDVWPGMAAEWAEFQRQRKERLADAEKAARHEAARKWAQECLERQRAYGKAHHAHYVPYVHDETCGHGTDPFGNVRMPTPYELRRMREPKMEDENDFEVLMLRLFDEDTDET